MSDEGLSWSAASAAVPWSRRLPGHAFLAWSWRPTPRDERRHDDHLVPGQGRPRSSAAAAQGRAHGVVLGSTQNEAQGKPKTGLLYGIFTPPDATRRDSTVELRRVGRCELAITLWLLWVAGSFCHFLKDVLSHLIRRRTALRHCAVPCRISDVNEPLVTDRVSRKREAIQRDWS